MPLDGVLAQAEDGEVGEDRVEFAQLWKGANAIVRQVEAGQVRERLDTSGAAGRGGQDGRRTEGESGPDSSVESGQSQGDGKAN